MSSKFCPKCHTTLLMQRCVTFIQQTVCYQSVFFVCRMCDTHTSHSLKRCLLNLHFHCIPQWYVLCFTCIISKCCQQYASVLQAGIIFQAINWLLFFYILVQKGPLLVVSLIKHTFTTTQNTKVPHILCMSIINCLLWHYNPKV